MVGGASEEAAGGGGCWMMMWRRDWWERKNTRQAKDVLAVVKRCDLIVSLAREIPGLEVNEPQGAFHLFPKCDSFFFTAPCLGVGVL